MNLLTLILLAIFPGIVLAVFIVLQDRYDKEPKKLLLKIFLLGIVATIPTMAVETIGHYFNIFTGLVGLIFEAVVVIGFSEEFFKRLVVVKYAYHHPAFNEKLDGIVYCSIAALGFATLENIFYVVSYSSYNPDIWITRGLVSVPAHMLLGITMGYYLSLSKFCPDQRNCAAYFKKSLYIPALLHGAFDFILMRSIPAFSLLLVPFIIFLWITSLKKLRKYYKESKAGHTHI
ncbi:MAG: PrsW family intramembrane metalloprotease [Christensenellales bacterium]|jgi:RsiW-degrading membrane proteinase PrsW (M82 family)